jgi:hypothetical protein
MGNVRIVQPVAGSARKEVVPHAADSLSAAKRNLLFRRGLPAAVRPIP